VVLPGKVGRRGSHWRWSVAVGQRKRPDVAAFQGGGGAAVAREDVDESHSWTVKVRHSANGMGDGGVVELSEGGKNGVVA
jgi:hypothetical protein